MALTDSPRLPRSPAFLAPVACGRETGGALGRLAARAEGIWTRVRDRRARQETLRLLAALDARTLKDLGVSPYEIESLVHDDSNGRKRAYDRRWWRSCAARGS